MVLSPSTWRNRAAILDWGPKQVYSNAQHTPAITAITAVNYQREDLPLAPVLTSAAKSFRTDINLLATITTDKCIYYALKEKIANAIDNICIAITEVENETMVEQAVYERIEYAVKNARDPSGLFDTVQLSQFDMLEGLVKESMGRWTSALRATTSKSS
ncbi:hypothetical protein LTR36_009179 [Oleoguttula mirabilis]|uniref:Uncharacterized protein n=1 Tax=Oleoguttula mirabilis TaxID=1507867 RepID=A0AAV9J7R8_9PEZI|nr:hypothetical protein LTR36_009179 [Oleoguttula mirabilis]